MKQWWGHHEGKLPVFEPESDKDRVEDLTGRIPLLLQPLLGWKGQRFGSIEQQFWHHRELAVVKKNILDFDRRMTNDPRKHALLVHSCPCRLTMLIPLPKIYRCTLRLLIRLCVPHFSGML